MSLERKQILKSKYGVNYEDKVRRMTSRINVYIADSNVVTTTEAPDYDLVRLVSDLGGQLGLWIGVSVITLVEVLQLGFDVVRVTSWQGVSSLWLTNKGENVRNRRNGEKGNSENGETCSFRPQGNWDHVEKALEERMRTDGGDVMIDQLPDYKIATND